MKIAILSVLFFFPTIVFAQNFPNMNQGDMQKIMQQMQKVQQCMEKIDQSELEGFEQKSQEADAKIKALCADGKRKKAQKEAIKFGKKVAKIKAIQEMKKCTESMEGIQEMLPTLPYTDPKTDYSNTHVCDQ